MFTQNCDQSVEKRSVHSIRLIQWWTIADEWCEQTEEAMTVSGWMENRFDYLLHFN